MENPKIEKVILLYLIDWFLNRLYWTFVFVIKKVLHRPLFKEKPPIDSHAIRQVFDEEKPDLAIFGTKADDIL